MREITPVIYATGSRGVDRQCGHPSDVIDTSTNQTLDVLGGMSDGFMVPERCLQIQLCAVMQRGMFTLFPRFSCFSGLNRQLLGPADYLTDWLRPITQLPSRVYRIFELPAKNQARRFISLIDALYDARCCLICHAATDLENLVFPDAARASNADQGTSKLWQRCRTRIVRMYSAPSISGARVQSMVLGHDNLKLDIISGWQLHTVGDRMLIICFSVRKRG